MGYLVGDQNNETNEAKDRQDDYCGRVPWRGDTAPHQANCICDSARDNKKPTLSTKQQSAGLESGGPLHLILHLVHSLGNYLEEWVDPKGRSLKHTQRAIWEI